MPFLVILDPYQANKVLIPGTRRYKIAGTVTDLEDNPLRREGFAIEKDRAGVLPTTFISDPATGAFSVRVNGGPGNRFMLVVHGDRELEEHSRVFDHLTAKLAF